MRIRTVWTRLGFDAKAQRRKETRGINVCNTEVLPEFLEHPGSVPRAGKKQFKTKKMAASRRQRARQQPNFLPLGEGFLPWLAILKLTYRQNLSSALPAKWRFLMGAVSGCAQLRCNIVKINDNLFQAI